MNKTELAEARKRAALDYQKKMLHYEQPVVPTWHSGRKQIEALKRFSATVLWCAESAIAFS
jgi:hypothetical protein